MIHQRGAGAVAAKRRLILLDAWVLDTVGGAGGAIDSHVDAGTRAGPMYGPNASLSANWSAFLTSAVML